MSTLSTRSRSSAGPTPSRIASNRHTTATPSISDSRARQSTSTATPASNAQDRFARLPPYEPPIAPLHAQAQSDLLQLLTLRHPTSQISSHLKAASAALVEAAGEINDKASEKENLVERRRALRNRRRQQQGESSQQSRDNDDNEKDEEDEEEEEAIIRREEEELRKVKERVDSMTDRMDHSLRKCIDGHNEIQNMERALKEITKNAVNAASLSQTQSQSQRGQTQRSGIADDEEMEDVTQPTTSGTQQNPALPKPSKDFVDNLQTATDKYTTLPLQARYSTHPDYVNFKRVVWDGQHPGDSAPPVPHASTWFASEEGTGHEPPAGQTTLSTRHNQGGEQQEENDDDDDDIAIDRVRISTKCPITLREFNDPVTSTKCSHSFEKDAIYSMIAQIRPPTGRRQPPPPDWVQSVKCPAGGCEQQLSKQDLIHDAVLVRKVKKLQRAREREAEGDDEEEEERGGGKGGKGTNGNEVEEIESDSGDDIDDVDGDTRRRSTAINIKRESQTNRSQLVEDIEDDEEDTSVVDLNMDE